MVSMKGTVELGASQLLVDGPQHSAMHWVLAVQATCSKTHIPFLLGCPQGETSAPWRMGNWTKFKTSYQHACAHGNLNRQKPHRALEPPLALTLSNGEDQVSFFPKVLVQLWWPKEAMPEGGEPSPSNSWLDSFLGRKAQASY